MKEKSQPERNPKHEFRLTSFSIHVNSIQVRLLLNLQYVGSISRKYDTYTNPSCDRSGSGSIMAPDSFQDHDEQPLLKFPGRDPEILIFLQIKAEFFLFSLFP